jgi:hypothetical protein
MIPYKTSYPREIDSFQKAWTPKCCIIKKAQFEFIYASTEVRLIRKRLFALLIRRFDLDDFKQMFEQVGNREEVDRSWWVAD